MNVKDEIEKVAYSIVHDTEHAGTLWIANELTDLIEKLEKESEFVVVYQGRDDGYYKFETQA